MIAEGDLHQELARGARDWPSWTLTTRQLGDLELILNGAMAPLDRFMTRADADACAREMRLSDGTPFPVPVLLNVTAACAAESRAAGRLVVRDREGVALAVVDVRETWEHDGHVVSGRITGLQLPSHADAMHLRHTADGVARESARRGWTGALAFVTRRVVHRAEFEITRAAIERDNAGLIIMALSDPEESDRHRIARIRSLEAVLQEYPPGRALIWLLPLARRSAADDAVLGALMARNTGCARVIATDVLDDAAVRRVSGFAGRVGVVYEHAAVDTAPEARMVAAGEPLPESYTFPQVADELAALYPPKHQRGFTLFFTGLSGSGKSTIANLVRVKLLERTGRPVTLLDGDLVRQHLSSELGFSREHRDLNIRRIAFVAAEITRHGGIAICAPIAPYHSVRQEARSAIEAGGGFVLVFVDTPLEVCEARDRKGLYAKARAGLIREFTGVSDPYEAPQDADVVIRTAEESADAAADRVVAHLVSQGYLLRGSRR